VISLGPIPDDFVTASFFIRWLMRLFPSARGTAFGLDVSPTQLATADEVIE